MDPKLAVEDYGIMGGHGDDGDSTRKPMSAADAVSNATGIAARAIKHEEVPSDEDGGPVKAEQIDGLAADEDNIKQENAAKPNTPRKRGRPKKAGPEKTGPETPKKRKLAEPKTPGSAGKNPRANLGPIPESMETASPQDQMMLRMRDEGKPWEEVLQKWQEMTGVMPQGSSLCVRLQRMKNKFIPFAQEDEERLIVAKKEIEARMEAEKWRRIAEHVEQQGGAKYPAVVLQKKMKQLQKAGVTKAAIVKPEGDAKDAEEDAE